MTSVKSIIQTPIIIAHRKSYMRYQWSQLTLIMNLSRDKIYWRKLKQKLEWLQRSHCYSNSTTLTMYTQEREIAEEVNREARRKLEDYRVPEV